VSPAELLGASPIRLIGRALLANERIIAQPAK